MADMPTPERGINKKIAAAVLAGGIAAGVAGYAATRGEPSPTQPPATETPSAAAASPTPRETPTVAPTPAPTAEPTPIPTPEVKKEVPCQILPIKYCNEGERVVWQQASGRTFTNIGFNFPAGERVPVFAGADGRLLLTDGSQTFPGKNAIIKTASGENYEIRGNIDTSKFGDLLDIPVKAGEIIGYAQRTSAKSLGSYDLVFTISKASPSGSVIVEEKLKELFPNAYEKPNKTFVSSIETRGGTGVQFQGDKKP